MNVLKMIYEETDDDGRETLRVTRIIPGEDLEHRDQHVAAMLMAAYRDLRNCAITTKATEGTLDQMARVLESGR